MIFHPLRTVIRLVMLVAIGIVAYFGVTLVQVWMTSKKHDPHTSGAIVVMGAAQYNGVPSPDLAARLDEANTLFHKGYSHLIGVTGSKEKGDVFTEAEASATYLEHRGVPAADILEAGGSDSWGNIAELVPRLRGKGVHSVLLVTDPFHEDRSMAIVSSFGLDPSPTPTRTSPIKGFSTVPYFAKEALGVGLGRIIGFQRLHSLG